MAIDLSTLKFTNKADIVPEPGTTEQIINTGTANTLGGNDIITGTGTGNTLNNFGIFNFNTGIINTDDGNDIITGNGDNTGILNNINSIINTGDGNDIITGTSGNNVGIQNDGTIDTGAGKDIVDALTGGFGGTGITRLADGNDVLKGFGTGCFDGGNGIDTLLFGSGTYTISGCTNSAGFYTVSKGSTDMFVKDFELIGSANNPAGANSFSGVIGGSFTVV